MPIINYNLKTIHANLYVMFYVSSGRQKKLYLALRSILLI
jgi:hypothetical protein